MKMYFIKTDGNCPCDIIWLLKGGPQILEIDIFDFISFCKIQIFMKLKFIIIFSDFVHMWVCAKILLIFNVFLSKKLGILS